MSSCVGRHDGGVFALFTVPLLSQPARDSFFYSLFYSTLSDFYCSPLRTLRPKISSIIDDNQRDGIFESLRRDLDFQIKGLSLLVSLIDLSTVYVLTLKYNIASLSSLSVQTTNFSFMFHSL